MKLSKSIQLTLPMLLTPMCCWADVHSGLREALGTAVLLITVFAGIQLATVLLSAIYYKRIARYREGFTRLQIVCWSLFTLSMIVAIWGGSSFLEFISILPYSSLVLLLSAELKRNIQSFERHAILFSLRSYAVIVLLNAVIIGLAFRTDELQIVEVMHQVGIAITIALQALFIWLYFKAYMRRKLGSISKQFCVVYAICFMWGSWLLSMMLGVIVDIADNMVRENNARMVYSSFFLSSLKMLVISAIAGYVLGVLSYKKINRVQGSEMSNDE